MYGLFRRWQRRGVWPGC
ncbi:hypothetical protein EF902_45165 [Streptomyces sp. WAC05858]|nr:hypothetical protein EF902_45165 [Streptomyces sp. WAC05858]